MFREPAAGVSEGAQKSSSGSWHEEAYLSLAIALILKVLHVGVIVHGSGPAGETDYEHLLGVKRLEYNIIQVKMVAARIGQGAGEGSLMTRYLLTQIDDMERKFGRA
jgi:hypothetical protein